MIEPADSLSQTPEQPEEEAPRKKRKPAGGFECKLGLLLGLCGLAASRLGQLWIAFDVFSQFTLQFAVITVAFLIGWVSSVTMVNNPPELMILLPVIEAMACIPS